MFEMLAAALGLSVAYFGLRIAQHHVRMHDDPQYRHAVAVRERQRQSEQRARDLEYLAECGDNEHIRRAAMAALDRRAPAAGRSMAEESA